MDSLLVLLQSPAAWIALATLVVMEVVLGIDNLVFISIVTNKLPREKRQFAQRLGIGLALGLRLALLGTIAFIVRLTEPLFSILEQSFSWKDLILIGGGFFLVWKATREIHHSMDPGHGDSLFGDSVAELGMRAAILQILMLDLVFSLDSIITAVGMTPHLPIMVTAVLVAVTVMLVAAAPLSRFLEDNPTIVMLALGFLLMIGMTLVAEGFGVHVPKGYIYTAMAFSGLVEGLNMAARKRRARSGSGGA